MTETNPEWAAAEDKADELLASVNRVARRLVRASDDDVLYPAAGPHLKRSLEVIGRLNDLTDDYGWLLWGQLDALHREASKVKNNQT